MKLIIEYKKKKKKNKKKSTRKKIYTGKKWKKESKLLKKIKAN